MLGSTITQASLPQDVFAEVKAVLNDTLQLHGRADQFNTETLLLGNIPELDSMAVVTVITGLEAHFGILVEDDDDLASAFESLGNLAGYVTDKCRHRDIGIG